LNHNNSINFYDNEKSKPIEMNLRSLALILSVYFFSKFPSLEVIGFQRSSILVLSLDDVHHIEYLIADAAKLIAETYLQCLAP